MQSRHLKQKNVWVFTDEHNSYSSSLAQNFSNEFKHGDNQVYPANYTVGDKGSVTDALEKVRSNPPPDLIYFAGYASDVNPLLERLPNKDLLVLGPNSLYELGGYQDKSFIPRVRLTAFAYPDEWGILGYGAQTPKFFDNYRSYFDPNNKHPGQYGYSRTDADVMLAYDATKVILTAAGNFLAAGNPNVTPKDLQNALEQITGNQAFQGVSGQISFDSDGNAMNKELLILCTTPERDGTGRFHLAQAQGQFLVGNSDQPPLPSFTTDCR